MWKQIWGEILFRVASNIETSWYSQHARFKNRKEFSLMQNDNGRLKSWDDFETENDSEALSYK